MVLTVSSRALLDACVRLGIDVDAMLTAVQVDRSTIYNPDARIPGEKVVALWRQAYERSGDPQLSLHAAEALPFGAYKVVDFLAGSATTIGEGFARVARYFPLINSVVGFDIALDDDPVSFRCTSRAQTEIPLAYAEYALAAVVTRCRHASGMAFPLERVDFAYPRPADISEHERIFGCPIRFTADHTRFFIARSVWDTPVPRGDDGLSAVLEAHARMLLESLPKEAGVLGQVREAIHRELRGGDPSLDHVAKKLGMSNRTLQRRLKDEGFTYAEVLDEVRTSVAQLYLNQEGISIFEAGHLLGFAEQSSFSRAFKRWTGTTPGEYRQRASGSSRASI
jgi:AraC-like DNA-binding protein